MLSSEVCTFLESRLPDVSAVAPLGSGEWSQAFSFRTGTDDRVVRFGAHREDYEKDAYAMRFAGPDLPVPRILEIGEAFGGVYSVSVRAFGTGFDGRPEAEYRRILPDVLRTLAALARVDVSQSSGYGMWDPSGRAPLATWNDLLHHPQDDAPGGRISGWRARLDSVPEAVRVYDESHRILDRLARDAPEARYLTHADLMGDNLLLHEDRVVAVVDWGNAMYGDFLYDLARMTFFSPWFPGLDAIDLRSLARESYRESGLDVDAFHERLRCCEVHLGIDAQVYNAFSERWDELERSGRRTLELASREAA